MNEPISEQRQNVKAPVPLKARGLRFPFDPIHIQQAFMFQQNPNHAEFWYRYGAYIGLPLISIFQNATLLLINVK